jgi:hypothetical protein
MSTVDVVDSQRVAGPLRLCSILPDALIADDAAARLHRYANGLRRALNNAATAALMAAAAAPRASLTTPAPRKPSPNSPAPEPYRPTAAPETQGHDPGTGAVGASPASHAKPSPLKPAIPLSSKPAGNTGWAPLPDHHLARHHGYPGQRRRSRTLRMQSVTGSGSAVSGGRGRGCRGAG